MARHQPARASLTITNGSADDRYQLRRTVEGLQMFTKVNVFNLTDFSRVLYVDTDVLLTRSMEAVWNITFGPNEAVAAVPTLITGLVSNKNGMRRHSKLCNEYRKPWNRKYNAGVFLARPIRALYEAWLAAIDDAEFRFECFNDQNLFNTLLARRYTRCIGRSFNCYDPGVVVEPKTADSAAHAAHFLCGEESVSGVGSKNTSGTTLTFGPPHILHFATNSKPWIATQHSYYQALWLRHNRSWRRP